MTTTTDTSLPLIMTSAGPQPTPPAVINAVLIAKVAATNPDFTANLPGSLIEDISSTMTGGLSLTDQMRVDAVNSVAPRTASPFIVQQQGQIYGVEQGLGSNASVLVVFTGSAPGFVIQPGFTVSDGQFQYVVPGGGVIGANNQSAPLFALCTIAGTFSIPANSVTDLVSSVPDDYTLTVTNPLAGIQSTGPQEEPDYLAQVLQAGMAVAQGLQSFLRTQLENVAGVQPRLVRVIQNTTGNWEIICGGGDPYQVAYAISQSLFDVTNLSGAVLNIVGITQANPGVVTTAFDHNLSSNNVVEITGVVGMTPVNGHSFTVGIVNSKSFSLGVDTTGYPAYISGGVVTPNTRNIVVSLNYYPDTYQVTFVVPLQQSVQIALTWNTISQNFINPAAISQLGTAALVAYVNSVPAGLPMNFFEMQSVFQAAVADVLPPGQLTRMVFAISIDGTGVTVPPGTGIIAGDPEGYFLTDATQISIVQG